MMLRKYADVAHIAVVFHCKAPKAVGSELQYILVSLSAPLLLPPSL